MKHAKILDNALTALRRGSFVLLHDAARRENEIDLVIPARSITPAHIATMRQDAGGALCVVIPNAFAVSLGLRRMHEMLADLPDRHATVRELVEKRTPYGDAPAFCITMNHRSVRTGITDQNRARTIRSLARLFESPPEAWRSTFLSQYRTPGHVPLLIGAPSGVRERQGHTELSLHLAELAGVRPVMVLCEMLDGKTHRALTVPRAQAYARAHRLPLIEAKDVLAR